MAGGSKGIGKGVVLALAREGADVAICARGKEELERVAGEISSVTGRRVLPIQADMTVLEELKRFVATSAASFGRIDILVFSANTPGGGRFAELSDEDWRYHLNVKLLGCICCVREVIPYMQKNHWGQIVIISGINGLWGAAERSVIATVKSGIIGFTKSLAHEFGEYNITVNAIPPGIIEVSRPHSHPSPQMLDIIARGGIKRQGSPEEVASVVTYLCSEKAGYLTGQVISVNGGAYV